MKLPPLPTFTPILAILSTASAVQIDCTMSDTTRCACTHAPTAKTPTTLPGTDCRVCTFDLIPLCVLWGSSGTRYGPLCEPSTCAPGKTWLDGKDEGRGCYCDWAPKQLDRELCPTPAGDCKCTHLIYNGTNTTTFSLPGQTCTVCPTTDASGHQTYQCTETGNKKNGYGPLCTGNELGPQCTGKGCVCNWMVTMAGPGWRNETAG
ncbi:hypothetical protein K458DRAFT_393359 [Lentithecium fluviatile CBS 122367]|uniref:Uncharacterized protein n=1 Tax=Lentithecium fluviatile CBS 122367 TaxID=1168545 RepID=A0A6G1IPB6_9PLEO|nr:hypothetical protein K458DRAFT_393359 [Lentithecium fluviatile CBS 122367]